MRRTGMAVEQVNGMGSDRSSGLRVYGAIFTAVLLALGVGASRDWGCQRAGSFQNKVK
jgi:hypothetical protein